MKIGTRGSLLARTQTAWICDRIEKANDGLSIETVIIQTTGDLRGNVPFAEVGTKGMFVKELEAALMDGSIDLAIHSLKDMPGELPEGLALVCVPQREDPRDALISKVANSFELLVKGARIGTSSARRKALIQELRPDLQVEELRGNLDTRMRKLEEGQYDAIVLAAAGLHRLGWTNRITEYLNPLVFIPAPGQGALALEARVGDGATVALVEKVQHSESATGATVERAFLANIEGGCSVPAGAYSVAGANGELTLHSFLGLSNGAAIRDVSVGHAESAAELGREAAHRLLSIRKERYGS